MLTLKPKDEVTRIQELFKDYINTPIKVLFSGHAAETKLLSIELAPLNALLNKPEKKLREDGKEESPKVIAFQFEDFRVPMVMEDVDDIRSGIGCMEIIMGDLTIRLEKV